MRSKVASHLIKETTNIRGGKTEGGRHEKFVGAAGAGKVVSVLEGAWLEKEEKRTSCSKRPS